MKKNFALQLLLLLGLLHGALLRAEAKAGSAGSCPTVIADRATGQFERTNRKDKPSRYECFPNAAKAKKKGYLNLKSLQEKDFTGWWRLSLKSVKDSCGDSHKGVGPALFVQVIQSESAVFADFCPSLGRQSGVRNDSGVITQRTEVLKELDNPLGCTDNLVEVSEQMTLSRIVEGSQFYSARFVTVRRCPNLEEGGRSCVTEYEGVGFAETHTIWPQVDLNASTMKNGCSLALTRCVECHENLKNLPELQP